MGIHSSLTAPTGDSASRRTYTLRELPADLVKKRDFPFIVRFYGRDAQDRMLTGEPFFCASEVEGRATGQHWLATGTRVEQ